MRPFSPDPPSRNRLPPTAPDRNSTTGQVSQGPACCSSTSSPVRQRAATMRRWSVCSRRVRARMILGSPIHEASRRGRLACVKLLCRARADIKQRDAVTSETPLHCAVVFGHVQVARILVEAGCDLNAQDLAGGVYPPARSHPRPPTDPPASCNLPRALRVRCCRE